MSDLSTDPSTAAPSGAPDTPCDADAPAGASTDACPAASADAPDGIDSADESAERRRPRFICEYEYTDDLLTRFARMQVSAKRRGALLLLGCIEIAIGLLWVFSPQSLHWAGLFFVAVGAYSLWYRSNMYQNLARRYIRSMEKDESEMGGRHRRIVVTDEAAIVFASDDRSQRYEFSEFTDFQHDEAMFVAIFGVNGIAFPVDSFTLGTAAEFGDFLASKRYPAGSMGPDTPNR